MLPEMDVAPADAGSSNMEENLPRTRGWTWLLDKMDFMGRVVESGDISGGKRFLPRTQDPKVGVL
jgi:hypothetical protein